MKWQRGQLARRRASFEALENRKLFAIAVAEVGLDSSASVTATSEDTALVGYDLSNDGPGEVVAPTDADLSIAPSYPPLMTMAFLTNDLLEDVGSANSSGEELQSESDLPLLFAKPDVTGEFESPDDTLVVETSSDVPSLGSVPMLGNAPVLGEDAPELGGVPMLFATPDLGDAPVLGEDAPELGDVPMLFTTPVLGDAPVLGEDAPELGGVPMLFATPDLGDAPVLGDSPWLDSQNYDITAASVDDAIVSDDVFFYGGAPEVGVDATDSVVETTAEDVNGDGTVTALDMLLLINAINSYGAMPTNEMLAMPEVPSAGNWDINRDGYVTPLDTLVLTNYFNQVAAGEFAGSSSEAVPQVTRIRNAAEDAPLDESVPAIENEFANDE